MTHRRLIAVDFDGVLHAYTTPWTDAATIADPPTPGAMAFLKRLVEDGRFDVVIVSSRLKDPAGLEAVRDWLAHHLVRFFSVFNDHEERHPETGRVVSSGATIATDICGGKRVFDALTFSVERPPAFLTIDDRGWNFDGTWPSLDEMAAFKPWNKGGKPTRGSRVDRIEARLEELARQMEDVARRAYAAGCGVPEFHEADCQEEVQGILDDVLGRRVAQIIDESMGRGVAA